MDYQDLRRSARERAVARPRVPFDGAVNDGSVCGTRLRCYCPRRIVSGPVLFLHGGYGIFGDLDLQDAYARNLALGLSARVVSVGYPLAPEHDLEDSAEAVHAVVEQAGAPVWICGDSAGGVVGLAVAARRPRSVAGLLLTNPNVDLTMGSWDGASDGPDPELSRWAFARWSGHEGVENAPALTGVRVPVFVAVGENDALRPEKEALMELVARCGVLASLTVLRSTGHGFMRDQGVRSRVIALMKAFLS